MPETQQLTAIIIVYRDLRGEGRRPKGKVLAIVLAKGQIVEPPSPPGWLLAGCLAGNYCHFLKICQRMSRN